MLRSSLLAVTIFLATSAIAVAEAPAALPLQGYLASADGKPLDGTFGVRFRLYDRDAPSGAASEILFEEFQDLKIEQGSFLAYLGDKEVLPMKLFKQSSIVYVGVRIDNDDELRPLLQLGTAPYAAFANACGDADTLGGKTAEQIVASARSTSGGTGVQGPKGDPGPKGDQGPKGDPAALQYRFISKLTGDCGYNTETNATGCSCKVGEIAISAGAWAGAGAVLNASRHQAGPTATAIDAERARAWTVTCLTLSGAPVECVEVQVVCLKI